MAAVLTPAANSCSLSSRLCVLYLARATSSCEWPLSPHHPLYKWAKATLPAIAPWGGGTGAESLPVLPRIPVAAAWPALPWTWAPEEESGVLGDPGWLCVAASVHMWASVPWPRADGCPQGHSAHQWLPLSRLCGRGPWVSFPVRGEALPQRGASLPVLGFSFGSDQRVGPKRPGACFHSYPQCADKAGGRQGGGRRPGLSVCCWRRGSPGVSLWPRPHPRPGGVLAALVGARTAPSAPLPASACSAFFSHQDSVPSQQMAWRHPGETEARGAGMERDASLGPSGKRRMWGSGSTCWRCPVPSQVPGMRLTGARASPLLAPAGRGPPAAPAPAAAWPWRAPRVAGSFPLLSGTGPGMTVECWVLKPPAGRSVFLAPRPCSGTGQHPRAAPSQGRWVGPCSPTQHGPTSVPVLRQLPHCVPVQCLLLPSADQGLHRPPPSRGPPPAPGNTPSGAQGGGHQRS